MLRVFLVVMIVIAAVGAITPQGSSYRSLLLSPLCPPLLKLPFELPSSWEAVLNQKEDLPYDSKEPLYDYGFGLSYNYL